MLPRRAVPASIIVAITIAFLYVYDSRGSWPTIWTLVVAHAYFLSSALLRKAQSDFHLSFFLSTQLCISHLSRYEGGKAPYGDSPLAAAGAVQDIPPMLRIGFAELVFGDLDTKIVYTFFQCVVYVCLATWMAAFLVTLLYRKQALFSHWWKRLIFITLCLSYMFLHGIMASTNGVSHRFYLLMYSFLGLLLKASLGIDPRPLLCLFDGFTFWSAGLSKTRNSSGSWHTGQALCRHV